MISINRSNRFQIVEGQRRPMSGLLVLILLSGVLAVPSAEDSWVERNPARAVKDVRSRRNEPVDLLELANLAKLVRPVSLVTEPQPLLLSPVVSLTPSRPPRTTDRV